MTDDKNYLTDISLYDLGGQDWDVTSCHEHKKQYGILKEPRSIYSLNLINDDETEEIKLIDMHPMALQSLKRTCLKIAGAINALNLED